MNVNEITLEMLNEKYQQSNVDNFKEYVELVSAFILNKKIPFECDSEEHNNLVALGNDYVFQKQEMRQKLLDKVRNITYEKLNGVLEDCGLSKQECKMIFACIYEAAFLGCVTRGEAPLYVVLRFPIVSVVLHWDRGVFYTTKF